MTTMEINGLAESNGTLSMGPGTYHIPLELFAENRRRLAERLRSKDLGKAIVLLQGGEDVHFYDTDTDYLFRQESYFMWAFGAIEPGCFGALEVNTGKAHLFVPRLPDSYAVWMGPLRSLNEFALKYGIADVHYVDDISAVLRSLAPEVLLTLTGVNTDSGLTAKEASFPGIEKFNVSNAVLFPEMAELRVRKTALEYEVMKYVIEVSSAAHRKVMRFAKSGRSEYACESEFLNYCYGTGGCRHVSYTCICGSGTNSAILHYGHAGAPNDKFIKDGEMLLYDMGANYFGYAADITCSYPANGKFTPDQKIVYEAVLEANLAVLNAAKPGVSWVDMHLLANKVMLEHLKRHGLLTGDVDEMIRDGLGATFQPHGLGHLLGLDVHDVGGYLCGQPERPKEAGVNKLRTARILEEGMFLTIEPGCYFIEPLLNAALNDTKLSRYLVPDVIQRFRNFGGVRIEDDVYVTKNGTVNLTRVPRTVQEIEDWIAGKDDDKY